MTHTSIKPHEASSSSTHPRDQTSDFSLPPPPPPFIPPASSSGDSHRRVPELMSHSQINSFMICKTLSLYHLLFFPSPPSSCPWQLVLQSLLHDSNHIFKTGVYMYNLWIHRCRDIPRSNDDVEDRRILLGLRLRCNCSIVWAWLRPSASCPTHFFSSCT